jgi:2,3-bisphosphoglycerate-dependent phosphoglycerate mutase
MTRIALIRHGSTAWNKEGRMQGSTDIPLDQEGLEQARRLGIRLSDEHWDLVYTSHLSRAKETGAIIAKQLGITDLREDKRLREVSGGETEGTSEADRIAKWGADWRQLELGMEPELEVWTRGLAFMEDLLAPALNVTEGLKNTSVTRFNIQDNKWDCELYNCTIHLNEV